MIYLINAFLILFWNLVISERYKNKKLILCYLYAFQWIIISGFRSYSVGADTIAYKISFDRTFNTSWATVFDTFIKFCRGAEGIKDPGYMFFEKACQILTGKNYTLYLLIIAIIFTVPMTIWIYKYSDNVCLSFMIYSALFYSFFAITGHRQTIASALVIFGGYECMKKNKIVPLLLLHIVAFFIHKSSLCFIILYFARFIKINKLYLAITSICILLSFIFRNQLMSLLSSIMGYEQYSEQFEGAGAYTFTAFLSMIYIATIILYKQIAIDEDVKFEIVAVSLALFFTPLTFIDPSAMRVVQYFSIFILLLLPKLLNAFDSQSKSIINVCCYLILLFFIARSGGSYSFVF